MVGTFLKFEISNDRKAVGGGIDPAHSGFTLMELLVVMLIIGILIGLGSGGYSLARRSAREGQAKADIELIRNALEEYRVEFGAYPVDSIGSLTNSIPAELNLIDPWGRAYRYSSSNRFTYGIWSEGIDPEDEADNIDPSRVGY